MEIRVPSGLKNWAICSVIGQYCLRINGRLKTLHPEVEKQLAELKK
jgi:hypothetical protein